MMIEIPDDIIDLEDEPGNINLMVYGNSGAGKTPFAASSEKCLLLRTEQGTASAKAMGFKPKIWPCDTWAKFIKAFNWVKKNCEKPEFPYEWITVDSGTMLQTLLLRKILADEYKEDPDKRDLDIPQIQDHQLWQNKFKRTMQNLVDLPVNLCVTALPMTIEAEDEEGNIETTILPQFLGGQGAISWAVVGMFDIGGRARLAKVKRDDKITVVQKIDWEQKGSYWARDRYSALGATTTNLTLDGLAAKVAASTKG